MCGAELGTADALAGPRRPPCGQRTSSLLNGKARHPKKRLPYQRALAEREGFEPERRATRCFAHALPLGASLLLVNRHFDFNRAAKMIAVWRSGDGMVGCGHVPYKLLILLALLRRLEPLFSP
jgi:hypothetical protein